LITRVKLKVPKWIVDPDEVHVLLQEVERQMGGTWETGAIYFDKAMRVYGFVRFVYTEPRSKEPYLKP